MAINFCPNCGAKINGANFCPNCGTKVNDTVIETPAHQAVQVPQEEPMPQPVTQQDSKPIVNRPTTNSQDVLKRFGLRSAQTETPPPQPALVPKPDPIPEPDYQADEIQTISVVPPVEQENTTKEEKKKILDEILKEADNPPPLAPQRVKRPEKQPPKTPEINNKFYSVGYADEIMNNSTVNVKIIEDDLYNTSANTDYLEYEDPEEKKETKKKSRGVSTSASRSATSNRPRPQGSPAIIQKATDVAAKKLITEDKKLENRQRVYIIEQEELPDPNDPSYDGYYENIIPIDELYNQENNVEGQQNKFTLNEDAKKTVLILLGLIVALIVVIIMNF